MNGFEFPLEVVRSDRRKRSIPLLQTLLELKRRDPASTGLNERNR